MRRNGFNWLGCGRAFLQKKHDHLDEMSCTAERARRGVVFMIVAMMGG